MKHLLFNGCSYGVWWRDSLQDIKLADSLEANSYTNLSKVGSSNNRIFHSTMEFILKNPNVDFVILSLTFCTRFDAPWADFKDEYDRDWVNYSPQGIFDNELLLMKNKSSVELERIKKYVLDRMVIDSNSSYVDRHLAEIIKFSAWLDSMNINYCIFNSCEDIIKRLSSVNELGIEKLNLIKQNKKIIDIENFMSNQWMYDNGATIPDFQSDIAPHCVHYLADGFELLNNFLYNYIKENCL